MILPSLWKKKHHFTGKTNVGCNLYTVLVIVEEMDIDNYCGRNNTLLHAVTELQFFHKK